MLDTPCPRAGCPHPGANGRHRHNSPDLNETGHRCACGACDWAILLGGLLPAFVTCNGCARGFNIGSRMEWAYADAETRR